MSTEQLHRLPDGRLLAYAEYGAQSGVPVLYCHATPGSRLGITPKMADTTSELGMRLIVPDRPGYGLSDPRPDRTLLDWPHDVASLMDALGISQFRVVGFSTGSIHALACAWALPESVTRVTLAGSLAPNLLAPQVTATMAPGALHALTLAYDDPEGLRQAFAPLAQAPEQLFAMMADTISLPDRQVLMQPELSEAFRRDCQESLRQGVNAVVQDYMLAVREWGFDLEEVETPIDIWQGLADINAPAAMANYLARRLSHCQAHYLENEGHLLLFAHWAELLTRMQG